LFSTALILVAGNAEYPPLRPTHDGSQALPVILG
jgi:hypothetical protein